MKSKYEDYLKADIAVDIIIITEIDSDMKVLLIKRRHEPFKDCRAIPGGYLEISDKWGEGETVEQAALRELQEETSLSLKKLQGSYLTQFKVYSDPKRDPRMRVISVVFYAIVPYSEKLIKAVKAGDDAKDAKWFSLKKLPKKLAFDHDKILKELTHCKINLFPCLEEVVSDAKNYSKNLRLKNG